MTCSLWLQSGGIISVSTFPKNAEKVPPELSCRALRLCEHPYRMAAMADLVLTIHLLWILWVIFGAFWTRGRIFLTAFHILSLVWGIVVELSPLPCPLTMAEQFFEGKAGAEAYRGGFCHIFWIVLYTQIFQRCCSWLLAWRCVRSTLVSTLGAFGIASRKLCETRKVFENL